MDVVEKMDGDIDGQRWTVKGGQGVGKETLKDSDRVGREIGRKEVTGS